MNDPDRARVLATWMVALVGFVALRVVLFGFGWPADDRAWASDFRAFYAGGALVAEGRAADLTDLDAQLEVQRRVFGRPDEPIAMGFFNPPPVAALLAPFSLLRPGAALAAWTICNDLLWLGALALALRRASPGAAVALAVGWVLFPPLLLARYSGQPVFPAVIALLGCAYALRANRPALAGLSLALLGFKPHLALAAAPWVLGAGEAALVGGYALGGLAWLAGSALIAGPGWVVGYPRLLSSISGSGGGHGIVLEHTTTVRGICWQLWGGPAPDVLWMGLAAGLAVALAALARRARDPERRVALLVPMLLTVPPHGLYHDHVLWLAALVLVPPASRASAVGWAAMLALHWAGAASLPWWPLTALAATAVGLGLTLARTPSPAPAPAA